MAEALLSLVSTVEHNLLCELGVGHPTPNFVVRVLVNFCELEGLFTQLVRQFDYFILHLPSHDGLELLLHLWCVAVVGAELFESLRAG